MSGGILGPVIAGAVSGLCTGTGAAIFTEWASWGKKRRLARDAERRRLVAEWRAGINAFRAGKDPRVSNREQDVAELMAADWYQTFRDRVSPDARARWEAPRRIDPSNPLPGGAQVQVTRSARRNAFADELFAELRRIEQDVWKLS